MNFLFDDLVVVVVVRSLSSRGVRIMGLSEQSPFLKIFEMK